MKRKVFQIERCATFVSVFLCAIMGFTDLAHAEGDSMPVDSVSAVGQFDVASSTSATRSHTCSPRTAFALGVLVPGGGQFYLRDWSGGIQAVVTDAILIEAMRRSEATIGSMAFFIGAVHVVEGLFAAYECRTRTSVTAARNNGTLETHALSIVPGFLESRVDRHEQTTGHRK
ncbi:MAG TPA: hypothetical protein ENN56_01135, partial [Firmicutes bacterium]|nr:hypothetical protein [Bacillota bacterium]